MCSRLTGHPDPDPSQPRSSGSRPGALPGLGRVAQGALLAVPDKEGGDKCPVDQLRAWWRPGAESGGGVQAVPSHALTVLA